MGVSWNQSKHSVGIQAIDEQHQELFSIAATLERLMQQAPDINQIYQLLYRLQSYTKFHFLTEEDLFVQIKFPKKDIHKAIHREFSLKIKNIFTELKAGTMPDLKELYNFLLEWITDHIQKEDQQYAKHIQNNKIPISQGKSNKPATNSISNLSVNQQANQIWDEKKLSLHIDAIDTQHKELIYLLQQLSNLNSIGINGENSKEKLSNYIQKLLHYAQYHFQTEEELMKEINYPALSQHKKLHQGFCLKIEKFARDFQHGEKYLSDDIIFYLKDWTINHILKEDAKIKHFMNKS
jgi:hemerythrin-like metal-binding protein